MYFIEGTTWIKKLKINLSYLYCRIFHKKFTVAKDKNGKTVYCKKCRMIYYWENK